jgi:hypothetical protein
MNTFLPNFKQSSDIVALNSALARDIYSPSTNDTALKLGSNYQNHGSYEGNGQHRNNAANGFRVKVEVINGPKLILSTSECLFVSDFVSKKLCDIGMLHGKEIRILLDGNYELTGNSLIAEVLRDDERIVVKVIEDGDEEEEEEAAEEEEDVIETPYDHEVNNARARESEEQTKYVSTHTPSPKEVAKQEKEQQQQQHSKQTVSKQNAMKTPLLFKCKYCNRVFDTKHGLGKHVTSRWRARGTMKGCCETRKRKAVHEKSSASQGVSKQEDFQRETKPIIENHKKAKPEMKLLEDKDVDGIFCEVCGDGGNDEAMILCDGCDRGSHTYCVHLTKVPGGEWFCLDCRKTKRKTPGTGEYKLYQNLKHYIQGLGGKLPKNWTVMHKQTSDRSEKGWDNITRKYISPQGTKHGSMQKVAEALGIYIPQKSNQ